MKKYATVSFCGKYRYNLERIWDDSLPVVNFIMLNPSTADAENDDPTIRRCIGFAKRWGYGGLRVLNLFAYRATVPKEMCKADDPIGPLNNAFIQEALNKDTVFAWGTNGTLMGRDWEVIQMVQKNAKCLGKTKGGFPKHPLYVAYNTSLINF